MPTLLQKITVADPGGVLLATKKKYCRCNLQVVPKLLPITIRQNGTYPIPAGYAGYGKLSVDIPLVGNTSLIAEKNGTYHAPEGMAYSSVEVNVPAQKPELPLTVLTNGSYLPPDGKVYSSVLVQVPVSNVVETDHYRVTVNETFGINHGGNTPTVICPACVRYYDDGGAVIFTAKETGAGTIYLYRADMLIGQYTVVVTAASIKTGNYEIMQGSEISIPISGTGISAVCPECVSAKISDSSVLLTGTSVGIGTVYLYREDLLIGQYSLQVKSLTQTSPDYTIEVGGEINISVAEMNDLYTIDYPKEYLHNNGYEGNDLIFTGIHPGSGSIVISLDQNVLCSYTFTVKEISSFDYTVAVGNFKSIPYADEYVTKVQSVTGCVSCGDLDSGEFDITGVSEGYDIVLVYRSLDSGVTYDLYKVYTINVTAKESSGSDNSGEATTPTISERDEGEKTVGDKWLFMESEHVEEWPSISITGGINKSTENGNIYLTAVYTGEACVTVTKKDKSIIVHHKYTIVAKSDGGDSGGGTTCTHANTTALAAIAATCTATGLTEGSYCTDCGTTIIAQKTVPMVAHTEVVDAAVAPTCTATGLTEGKHCSVCNTVITKQEVTNALGHSWGDPTPDDDITTGKSHTCAVCGTTEMIVDRTISVGEEIEFAYDDSQEIEVKCIQSCIECTLIDSGYFYIKGVSAGVGHVIVQPKGQTTTIDRYNIKVT